LHQRHVLCFWHVTPGLLWIDIGLLGLYGAILVYMVVGWFTNRNICTRLDFIGTSRSVIGIQIIIFLAMWVSNARIFFLKSWVNIRRSSKYKAITYNCNVIEQRFRWYFEKLKDVFYSFIPNNKNLLLAAYRELFRSRIISMNYIGIIILKIF